jgi:hypothetical protein
MAETEVKPMSGEIYENPMYREISWVQRALLDQHRLQGIAPGKRICVPFTRLYPYCPEVVLEFSRTLGKQDFQAVAASVDIAAELGLIGMSRRTGPRYAHEYWLPAEHPAVRRERLKRTVEGNVISLCAS